MGDGGTSRPWRGGLSARLAGGSPLLLDTLTKFSAKPRDEAGFGSGRSVGESEAETGKLERLREDRWKVLYEVREALAGAVDKNGLPFRTSQCLRRLLPYESFVDVLRSEARQKGRYGRTLRVCGSVWGCPWCASNIAEGRRDELERALRIAEARGYGVVMVTRTVRHKASWSLQWQLERFLAAEVAMGANGTYRRLLERLGFVGCVRVLEVTWGESSGWHVHTHSLLILGRPLVDLEAARSALFECWRSAAGKQRFATSPDAFELQATYGGVADYVAKFGREPVKRPWGAEDELARGHVKIARREGRYSPFALARDHPERFVEYLRAFKGRSQLQWSPGLRSLLLPSDGERSDMQLAQEAPKDYESWGMLSKEEFRAIDYARLHHRLMTLVGRGDRAGYVQLVESLRGRYAWLAADHDVGADELEPASALVTICGVETPYGDLHGSSLV